MIDATRKMEIDPIHAARVVGDFCDQVDLTRRESFSIPEACDFLTRMGYACTPGTVAEFVRKKYVAEIGDTLDCTQLYCFMAALDCRRRWQPSPCIHDPKKTGLRIQLEELVAQGINPPFNDLDAMTVEDALLQMCMSPNRFERETLYEALTWKLAGFEE